MAAVGIDLSKATERLLDEGIAKFIKAFDEVMETIAAPARSALIVSRLALRIAPQRARLLPAA